jgi:hypothetical protein
MKIDAHGMFSAGLFLLTLGVFGLLAWRPALADNHLFATLAQGVVLTGLINLAASFYYGASKTQPPYAPPPKAPSDPS